MKQIEFMKVFWRHDNRIDPKVMLYEVDLKDGRYIIRAVEVFADRQTKRIENFYKDVIEVTEMPTINEVNHGIFGSEFSACRISKTEFEKVWNDQFYEGNIP